ncbi:MAG: hypothetical protein LJE94_13055 [Deltaproteobacteria bacterium]|nr:hypothetical protein [Deltaproteobacteria bacterium]
MAGKMIECPRDTQTKYNRDVCENVFRKGDIRVWCKTCEAFGGKGENTAQGDTAA